MKKKRISSDRYREMLDILPPIYVETLDGQPLTRGFACSEAYNHLDNGDVVVNVYFVENGRCYETYATLKTAKGVHVKDTYKHSYCGGYAAYFTPPRKW